jgi:hypothetical protein
MMTADYESAFDTIQITLGDVDHLNGGSEVIDNGVVIVGYCDRRPAVIDIVGTQDGFERGLRIAAKHNDLDAEALIAASKAAIAAPDRPVRLDVGARIAA